MNSAYFGLSAEFDDAHVLAKVAPKYARLCRMAQRVLAKGRRAQRQAHVARDVIVFEADGLLSGAQIVRPAKPIQ